MPLLLVLMQSFVTVQQKREKEKMGARTAIESACHCCSSLQQNTCSKKCSSDYDYKQPSSQPANQQQQQLLGHHYEFRGRRQEKGLAPSPPVSQKLEGEKDKKRKTTSSKND